MASILQVPTLTIVLLSDVCLVQNWLWLVHNLLLCIDVDIQYFLYMMSHIISSKPNEHKTFDIISISFTHILFKALTMELYINDLLQCKLRPLNHQSQSMLRDLIF